MENKKRDLRMKRNMTRRTEPTNTQMPANKKRKLNSEKYNKVVQKTSTLEKRKEDCNQERQEKRRKTGPLLDPYQDV